MSDSPQDARGPRPVERVRGEHPSDESWRADALARSRHSDLRSEIVPPLDDHDALRAGALCGEICRNALGGLAAGLILLPPESRPRAQAAAACAVALFDFARQSGLDGEKLALINRWEFELERALSGTPAGQPVFVQVARLHAEEPWPLDLFDGLVAAARRRVAWPRPEDEPRLEAECRDLGRLALLAVGDERPGAEALDLAALLVRTRRLLALGDDLRRHQAGVPTSLLPPAWEAASSGAAATTRAAAAGERDALGARLRDAVSRLDSLSPRLRPAGRFALGAARRLVGRLDPGRLNPAPELGLVERLWLLARSRF